MSNSQELVKWGEVTFNKRETFDKGVVRYTIIPGCYLAVDNLDRCYIFNCYQSMKDYFTKF